MSIPELLPHYTKELAVPFTPRAAVKTIVSGRLSQGNARGHGNRAARREAELKAVTENERKLKEVFDDIGSFGIGLTPQDVDAMAEVYAESRLHQTHTNFHE